MSPDHIGKYGRPRDAVNRKKEDFLSRGVSQYLRENDIKNMIKVRIDVIEIFASDKPVFCVRKLTHRKGGIDRSPEAFQYHTHPRY